jgi:hypothetical protein
LQAYWRQSHKLSRVYKLCLSCVITNSAFNQPGVCTVGFAGLVSGSNCGLLGPIRLASVQCETQEQEKLDNQIKAKQQCLNTKSDS